MREGNALQRRLVASRLYRPLLEARRGIETRRVRASTLRPVRCRYCVSPYKTGTTYLSGLFAEHHRVAHEPMHYTTLNRVWDVDFMRRRQSLLDLELECSGFLSRHLTVLRQVAPDAALLFIARPPDDWISSVVNYSEQLARRVRWNYVARLFFDPICGHPIERFFELDDTAQHQVVSRLLDFWIEVYEAARADARALVVDLRDVDDRLGDIEDHLRLKATRSRRPWQRSTPRKRPFSLADHVEAQVYRAAVSRLGYSL